MNVDEKVNGRDECTYGLEVEVPLRHLCSRILFKGSELGLRSTIKISRSIFAFEIKKRNGIQVD